MAQSTARDEIFRFLSSAWEAGRNRPAAGAIRRSSRALGLPKPIGRLLKAAAVVGAFAGATAAPALAQTAAAPSAPSVIVAPIVDQDVSTRFPFVGNVEAIQQVDLKARVQGFLDQVAFTEGAYVKTGQLLYQIEQAPFQAQLAQAQGQLAAGKAQLASAQANLQEKQLTLDRQTALVKSGTVSQAVVDTATADRDVAAASVQQAQAAIAQAEAQVQTAQLNLSYTTISAPIAGRIGVTNYTVGNLVNESSGTLSTLVQVNPIRVAFAIPEKDYVTVMRNAAKGAKTPQQAETVTDEAAIGAGPDPDSFKLSLVLPDGSSYKNGGKVEFINNQVNANTGTVTVRAMFDNPDNLLLPGEYVMVTIQVGDTTKMPVVPQSAVLQTADSTYVFVLDTDNKAVSRTITYNPQIKVNGGYAVTSGLIAGETVIVDGVQKVKPGMVVAPTYATAASNPGIPVTEEQQQGTEKPSATTDKTAPAATAPAAPAAGK